MFYENNKFLCSILFLFCIFGSIFSPKYPEQVEAQNIPTQTKTQTGKVETRLLQPPTNSGTITKPYPKEGRKECNTICKSLELQRLGIIKEIADSLITNCKALADDARLCVIAGASIVISESGGGKNCMKSNKYSCFGITKDNNYKSYEDATLHFAGKFQKWWRNAKSASFFYPKRGEVSPSRFCTSEESSGSSVGCENGRKNAQNVWDKLEKLF